MARIALAVQLQATALCEKVLTIPNVIARTAAAPGIRLQEIPRKIAWESPSSSIIGPRYE
jgi:hypothetical protein